MTFNAAGKRTWSPRGRPKSHARDNGYSLAEGGVATSYPAFGAFMGRVKAVLRDSLLFAAFLIVANVSVAQVTAPGTVVRNVGTVSFSPVPARRALRCPTKSSLPFNRCRRAPRSRSRATKRQAPAALPRARRSVVRPAASSPCLRRPRSAEAHSIPRSRFRCRTPPSRTPVIRSSCAWSTSTATAMAM
jgi:hypothetical protein